MLFRIIASAVAATVLLIVLLVLRNKRKTRENEIRTRAQDKMREEALDRVILNDSASIGALRSESERPFSVDYSAADTTRGVSGGKRLMLQMQSPFLPQ